MTFEEDMEDIESQLNAIRAKWKKQLEEDEALAGFDRFLDDIQDFI